MKRPVRVLHVLGTLDPGGVETWLLHLTRHIDRACLRFDFCTFGAAAGLHAETIEALGARVLRCPLSRNLWAVGRNFRSILKEGGYDAVHSHVHLFSGLILRWAVAEGVPLRIAHSHITADVKHHLPARGFYRALMQHWIDKHATHGIAVCQDAARELFGPAWKTDERCRVLRYGIDPALFQLAVSREAVRNELGIPAGAPVMGHVGRFIARKNHRFFLDTAREILKKRSDAHFLLVGDGPLRTAIAAQARKIGLGERVHVTGIRTDVPRILRGAIDVLIFPSQAEGFPMAVIEAQAAGVPCVLSCGITKEVAQLPGEIVRMDLSRGPREWAAEAIRLMQRRDGRGGSSARWFEQSDFSIRSNSAALTSIYNDRGTQGYVV